MMRDPSKVGSGFGKRIANWIGREKAFPSNVLHMATETKNRNHSAVFPEDLPEWFIKLFTKEQDMVLDPFMGSGTTIRVAQRMNRSSIGIEILPKYYQIASQEIFPPIEIESSQLVLLEKRKEYESTKSE